jgi:hypothetical protein
VNHDFSWFGILAEVINMKTKVLLFVLMLCFSGVRAYSQTNLIAPGTPCADLGITGPCTATPPPGVTVGSNVGIQALFNLLNDPGNTNLGVFVVPGDVVLFEHPPIGPVTNPPNPALWSDLLHFSNIAGVAGSTATIFADLENGVVGLPIGFTLSANAVGILEIQQGTGTDADFTVYNAGSNSYQVHSDAASPELPDPEVPEPATSFLIAGVLVVAGTFQRYFRGIRTGDR